MRNLYLALFLLFLNPALNAKVVDKMVAVIDDKVITQSMVDRIASNFEMRHNIAPFIYSKSKRSTKELAHTIIQSKVIRDKLAEFGYVVSDEQVDDNVKQRTTALGMNQKDLTQLLSQNKMTFKEYFELTRESLEYGLFVDRVITPLIAVTEQEIKAAYYQKFKETKTMGFKYDLVDFSMPRAQLTKEQLKDFRPILKKFQISGNLPKGFKDVATNTLGELSEDGLTPELKKVLKNTEESEFTEPFLLGDDYHVIFVKKKDLVESEDYIKLRNRLRQDLTQQATEKMTDIWINRQLNSHYLKHFE